MLSAKYACVQPNINHYHKMYHTIVIVPGTQQRPHSPSDDPRDPGATSWYQRLSQGPRNDIMVPATIPGTQQWPHGTSDDHSNPRVTTHGTSDDPMDTEAAS